MAKLPGVPPSGTNLCREHLEGLEDKLREYKTAASDPKLYDDKVSSHAHGSIPHIPIHLSFAEEE